MKINKARGFTLVELLVVISIIGLLSSVVLASLNTARGRSKDAAIIAEVIQLRNLMHLEYSDTGSYAGLQGNPGWVFSDTASCPAGAFSSVTRAAKALEICNKIGPLISGSGNRLFIGSVSTSVVPAANASQSFSIMARLSSSAKIFCVGHNGKTSTAFQILPANAPDWGYTNDGCWADPDNK
jgi:prepilin-type N-terminal cleavage/methylation domain-containing protein